VAREKCKNPGCDRVFNIRHPSEIKDWRYVFCPQCKRKFGKVQFGYKLLVAQVDYNRPIKETLVSLLRQHRNANIMADLLNISKPTLYTWIKKFFAVESFLEFKQQHLCAGKNCISISKEDIGSKNLQSAMTKLRKKRICHCSIWGRKVMLVSASMPDIRKIVQSKPLSKAR